MLKTSAQTGEPGGFRLDTKVPQLSGQGLYAFSNMHTLDSEACANHKTPTVEPLNVDSLKCKNLHAQDTFVKSQCNRIIC